jgi:hypothetical protein
MQRKRHYVGTNSTLNNLLYINDKDEDNLAACRITYSKFIGPFRTKASALYYKNTFARNPHINCVADAEKLFKVAKKLGLNNVMWNIIPATKKD